MTVSRRPSSSRAWPARRAAGELNLCHHVYDIWHQDPDLFPHFTGTHASHYYVSPSQFLFRVPDEVPDTVAASANCGLSQVWAGVKRAELRAGEHLVVQGAGGRACMS